MSRSLDGRRLYLCTPDRPDLERFVAACVRGGVDVVQLREKGLEARPLLARARALGSVCADLGVPFIVNDRPDLALEAGADGVHVGQDDAPPALARRILGPGAIVGLSTHSVDDLERAGSEPVDYVSAGPVVATPTKPGREPDRRGLRGPGRGRARPCRSSSPGGSRPTRWGRWPRPALRHFVVVRWLTGAADPESAARALRRAIDAALAASGPDR